MILRKMKAVSDSNFLHTGFTTERASGIINGAIIGVKPNITSYI